MSTPDKWIWMPHAGHFICGNDCRFKLNTCVGDFIVSTVGELWHDSKVREIKARVRSKEIKGRGDDWDANYLKEFGYDEIGYNRKYETMVFAAKKSEHKCCPWEIVNGRDFDFEGYNDPRRCV